MKLISYLKNLVKSTPVSPTGGKGHELNVDATRYHKLGYAFIAVIFAGFGSWSALAPLDSAVIAPATVTVESFKKQVQHLEGGIVKKIYAREGEFVQASQLLLELDDTQIKVQLQLLEGELLTLGAQQARLIAERDNLAEIVFDNLHDGDPRIAEIRKGQQHIFATRLSVKNGEEEILQHKIKQLTASVEGLHGLIASKNKRIRSYEAELTDLRKLMQQGYANKAQIRQLERDQAELEGEVAEHSSQIAGIEIQVGETRLEILQLTKNFQTETADQLDQVHQLLLDKQERLRSLQDILARTRIYAPVAGKVLGLSVHTLGGVIKPGATILELVPQADNLVLDAQVSPADISRLELAQAVELRFNTFKKAATVIAYGEVVNISADSLVNEEAERAYYLARVALSRESLDELEKEGKILLPGMPAEVLIKTGQQTFLDYILQPVTDMLARSFIEE
ncbi:HlyD family type I secretion periplasmic adaptor subunit [Thalassomonas actiniarum]|uniref:Membrane fusion protein (MFP) family protein n=1 Tax=Thalassomonas actiniarum TaxID=485447 RepID=A0AAE9YRF8_9GAMM|nr:HlyD family type I secretion periplasmic adaptor subunit [Thalassomonas actiniarum]WDD99327.1 HlyD family type I secretion periplasmic adaptor subunit [Thalassomonas actiniarum]